VDRYSNSGLDPLTPGIMAELNDHRVTVVGQFSLGMFFYADGAALLRNVNLPQLAGGSSREATFGLVVLSQGANPETVKRRLTQALPADVRVLTRRELLEGEEGFFLSTKPLGIMVEVGLTVAFLAGAVVLWQVLSSEISRRLNEFATLAALGFSPTFVLGVGFCETLLLGLAAFLPAALMGAAILAGLNAVTQVPTTVGPHILIEVLLIVLLMCLLCGISVAGRIACAEPARLF
ncbi:MAG: hypothetical protein JO256_14815, partial [Alphaproteobacteria bacterium]|nr:hypothetical protein [Alphaproteobacteria bacterium]